MKVGEGTYLDCSRAIPPVDDRPLLVTNRNLTTPQTIIIIIEQVDQRQIKATPRDHEAQCSALDRYSSVCSVFCARQGTSSYSPPERIPCANRPARTHLAGLTNAQVEPPKKHLRKHSYENGTNVEGWPVHEDDPTKFIYLEPQIPRSGGCEDIGGGVFECSFDGYFVFGLGPNEESRVGGIKTPFYLKFSPGIVEYEWKDGIYTLTSVDGEVEDICELLARP